MGLGVRAGGLEGRAQWVPKLLVLHNNKYYLNRMIPQIFRECTRVLQNICPKSRNGILGLTKKGKKEPESQNVNFFSQIIPVQLNLPQEKAHKSRQVFDI